MVSYREALAKEMQILSKDPLVRFIGYNTANGSRMYHTLDNVPVSKCMETPVAENLMMGIAMGMCLEGYRPVVCFERMDFMLVAADAIINHLDKLPWTSGGQVKFPLIIRACVGYDKPLDPGVQHIQDYSGVFREKCHRLDVRRVLDSGAIMKVYQEARRWERALLVVEYKALYGTQ